MSHLVVHRESTSEQCDAGISDASAFTFLYVYVAIENMNASQMHPVPAVLKPVYGERRLGTESIDNQTDRGHTQ